MKMSANNRANIAHVELVYVVSAGVWIQAAKKPSRYPRPTGNNKAYTYTLPGSEFPKGLNARSEAVYIQMKQRISKWSRASPFDIFTHIYIYI